MKLITLIAWLAAFGSVQAITEIGNEGLSPKNNQYQSVEVSTSLWFFSYDRGISWELRNEGLPGNMILTDLAISRDHLILSTAQNGMFVYQNNSQIWKGIGRPKTPGNISTVAIGDGFLLAGTRGDGVFNSKNGGNSWVPLNQGLQNLTITKIRVFKNGVFAGTDEGLYELDKKSGRWNHEFGGNRLQVTGITEFEGEIYIGTNRGVYRQNKKEGSWEHVMADIALYNISSDLSAVYALAYNELLFSIDRGKNWKGIQEGLPKDLYTFQVIPGEDVIFAGQWDGVYKKQGNSRWEHTSTGIPEVYSVIQLGIFKDILVAGCTLRRLRKGVKIEK